MEEVKKENVKEYQYLCRNLPDPILIIGAEGEVLMVSEMFEILSGYKSSEVVGKNIFELPTVAKEDVPILMSRLKERTKGGKIPLYEIKVNTKSGKELTVEINGCMIIFRGKWAALLVLRDVTEQRITREALAESERKYGDLIRNVNVGVYRNTGGPQGFFLQANPAMVKIFGYDSVDEFLKVKVSDLYEKSEERKKFISEIRKNGSVKNKELRLKKKDGSLIWCSVNAKAKYGRAGEIEWIDGAIEDITERKKAELALKEREDFFKHVLENSFDTVSILNPDGTVRYFSKPFENLLGYKAKERIGKKPFELIDPEDLPRARDSFAALIKSPGAESHYEVKAKHKNGYWVYLEAVSKNLINDPVVRGIIVNYRDITERRIAGESLRKAAEIINSSADAIISVDLEGKISSWNKGAEDIYGYLAGEIIGKPKSVLSPEDISGEFFSIFNRIKNGEEVRNYETIRRKKDGSLVNISLTGSPIKNEYNRIVGASFVGRDITDKKIIENALKESEEKWRSLVANAPNFILMVDKNGKILLVNKVEQPGFSVQNAIGASVFNFARPENRWIAKKYIRLVFKTGKSYSFESGGLGPNKTVAWYLTNVGPIKSGSRVVAVAFIITDITKRKEMEEDILLKNTLLEAQSETSIDGILAVDEKGKTILFNKRFGELWNIPKSILDTKDDKKMVAFVLKQLKDPKKFAERIKYLYTHKNKKSRDEILLKDGKVFDRYSAPLIDLRGVNHGRIWYFNDITVIKKAENDLKESNDNLQKFKLATDAASDHIVITDPDGNILYANKGVERITGFSEEEVIGKKAGSKENWGGQMHPDFYKKLWRTIKDEKKVFIGEVSNKRKDGELYEASVSIAPIIDDNGNLRFFVGIERDITEEKRIDRAKTEFISLASHQLRTPLTTLNWYSEILLAGDFGALNEKQQEYIKDIYLANQTMIKLVNALLNVSRIEIGTFSIEPEPTDFFKLADSVIEEIAPQFQNKKHSFSRIFPKKLPIISIDPRLVRIVLQNLLTNAITYTPDGGKIGLKVTKMRGDLLVEVSDNGLGIPKSQQSKIFTKLFRADNIKARGIEGTGLGLYIVKAIIEQSGGRVWFESKINKGTRFYFAIPLRGMREKRGTKRLS